MAQWPEIASVRSVQLADECRARHAGHVVTHRTLLTSVWGPAHREDLQYLRVFIGQLRAKIERDAATPTIIRTEPGVGYRVMTKED